MHRSYPRLILIAVLILGGLGCNLLILDRLSTEQPVNSPFSTVPTDFSVPQVSFAAESKVSPTATLSIFPTFTLPASSTPVDEGVRFALIGDYGQGDNNEADIANLVKGWEVDFIITLGDNNYPSGSAETIDQNIGQFYHEYIYPYRGEYGEGAVNLRFFPVLGNHDLDTNHAQAYFDYFELPGNERYYDFIQGPVHFFALNTDSREPDGVGRSSAQAQWLQERLAASSSPWKIVYGHHPPYTSGLRGPVDWIRWPFKEWGATAYICGHDHFYERLEIDGMPYFINGIGGGAIYDFGFPTPGSIVRFNNDYGAMLVSATDQWITFQFITRSGSIVDEYSLVNN